MFSDDGFLHFNEEKEKKVLGTSNYKLLIVDDEESIHEVTKLVVASIEFQGHGLEVLHAYSASQAEAILTEHKDVAVILLDVVMETDSAGLDLVKVIREKLNNKIVRIILRTGQPGHAPETEVIVNYDINDYKNKSELTTEKLFSSLITALRSYSDLVKIEKNKIGLEKVLASTASIINMGSIDVFFGGLLEQVISLINDESALHKNNLSVYLGFYQDEKMIFDTGTGTFENESRHKILQERNYTKVIDEAISKQENLKTDECFVLYHHNDDESAVLILFEGDVSHLSIPDALLTIFIKNIAITYNNLLLSHDIKESQKETIFVLSEMAEQRSRETGKHVKRVAFLAKEIGEEMGLNEKDVEELCSAAPMHDIGKIAISDKVLKKPGPLTDDEYKAMQLHAFKGYELLRYSEKSLMRSAAIIAYEHHEHYNGKGYPRGISGDDIHVYARITALCDVFDALSSKRVYKEAWTQEKVLELIHEQRGEQFDPKVVDAFYARLDPIMKIMHEYKDEVSDEAYDFSSQAN